MTLVERLRHRARFQTCEDPIKLLEEAANRIEELETRIVKYDAFIDCLPVDRADLDLDFDEE